MQEARIFGFRDRRHEKTAQALQQSIHRVQTSTLSCLALNRSQQVSFSNLLHHDHVHIDQFIYAANRECAERIRSGGYEHVLLPNDTTESNHKATAGYRKGDTDLGVAGNNSDPGFFFHTGVALDPKDGSPLGCASVEVWTRGGLRPYKQVESRKWFQVADNVRSLAPKVTLINDREGEIYELWEYLAGIDGVNLVTRARQDRVIVPDQPDQPRLLFEAMSQLMFAGTFELKIKSDEKKQRSARQSVMEVRIGTITLRDPKPPRKGEPRGSLPVQAIEIRERASDVPEGEKPLVWRILTDHPVDTFPQAMEIIKWYIFRWRCEDTFAALKSRSLDLESSRLNSGSALMKLGVMSIWGASKITELVKRREDEITNAREFFQEEELACMEDLLPQLEGKTLKQQNPYARGSVAWAVWIIARLGHWHGTGKPGVEIIKRGLERFDGVFLGWKAKTFT